jgi:hypothetical protein
MSKKLFRIGLLLGLCRNALQWFVHLLGVLTSFLQTSLAYVWSNRRKTPAFMKAILDVLKVVIDLIKVIRTLLFCNQTAHFVHVAG